MELSNADVTVAFIFAFVTCALITPFFRRLAIYLNIVDKPNQKHKTHILPVPYLGGLSIIVTVCGGLALVVILKSTSTAITGQIIVLISTPLMLAIVGLVDDVNNLGAVSRLFLQTLFAMIVALIFAKFGWFGEPTNSLLINVSVSIFWIVGITNSLNFIDNLDGGAGGVVVISGLSLSLAALLNNQFAVAATSTLIAGATLGFLVWNLYPARIYLGDSGALFLGALLSVLAIKFNPETTNPVSSWIFIFLIFAVPILDVTLTVISRIRSRTSPVTGGRDHISHRLINCGASRRLTAVLIWTLQAYFSSLGFLVLTADDRLGNMAQMVAVFSWASFLIYFLYLAPMGVENNRNKT